MRLQRDAEIAGSIRSAFSRLSTWVRMGGKEMDDNVCLRLGCADLLASPEYQIKVAIWYSNMLKKGEVLSVVTCALRSIE